MRIAFIGVGQVGAPLADHLQRLGHTVVVAAKDPASASVQKALARNPQLLVAARRVAVWLCRSWCFWPRPMRPMWRW
ncbi:MAG: NAD(P)-binding domain-containing protein [Cyanobacteriota bacterium]|jgi:3-hydroxyisobutyrate dehydrogenase-like beta-hydroxyacid dehydrogenase